MSSVAHRILIVEDQRLIAADIANTLMKLGYAVAGNVSSADAAISASEQLRPELVLMDVRLRGDMDGIHAAEIIRDRFNVPVVYLTAYADEETILRAKKTTPFGYLVKPFNERELRATIEIAFYSHQMERALVDERVRRHAAEEFKVLVDGVTDYAIYMLDIGGRVTTWNRGAERLKGYKAQEVVGLDFAIFYTEAARRAGHPRELLETALREGRSEEENWRVRKDGTRFWASVVITPIRDDSGAPIGFAKVTRDLTERRQAEAKQEADRAEAERVLRESEEKFRSLVDQVRDYAIFSLDPEGRVVTWNAGAERIMGFRADEIIGQSIDHSYVPADVTAGIPGRLLRQATEQGVATDEGERTRKDGSRFWASGVITALHDKAGRLRGFTRITRDITEQKHAEQSMAILSDASRLMAESLDSEKILSTLAHMVVPAFADSMLIHARDPQDKPRLALYHASNPEMIDAVRNLQQTRGFREAAPSRRVMQSGRSELHPVLSPEWLHDQEVDEEAASLVRKFGVSSAIYVPISWAGPPRAVLVLASSGTRVYNEADLVFAEELARRVATAMHNAELFQDAKREKERAEEEVRLRERLVAIVGHDLRNPLTAIAAAAEVLGTYEAVADDELVGLVHASVFRMARLISQILDFSRIRSGQSFALQIVDADLHKVCETVIDEFRLGSPGQKITLSAEGRTRVPMDPDRIAQLLSNLIGNAIQHGRGGPVEVKIREQGLSAVAIEIHNLGPAIPLEMQPRLFEAFSRGEYNGRGPNIGLGLFIADVIVRAHQGSITVRSPDREGTTFCVVLPREPAA